MCIICVSERGVKQPSEKQIVTMFNRNPHGAGYMVARDGAVEIHKGFMNVSDLLRQLNHEAFTSDDPVVYHFRISTQAGGLPSMTHPFPLARDIRYSEKLDLRCSCGVAHNGIIRMTSTGSKRYSDTALFVSGYMSHIVRCKDDLRDPAILETLERLTASKLAIMDATGEVALVGKFLCRDGLMFSNSSFEPKPPEPKKPYQFRLDEIFS